MLIILTLQKRYAYILYEKADRFVAVFYKIIHKSMKRIICATILLQAVAAVASADESYAYPYLTFRDVGGSVRSVSSESLEITFADGRLIAHSATDNLEIALSELDKMYFSTESSGGVNSIEAEPGEAPVTVYSMQGVKLGSFVSKSAARRALQGGIYVVETAGDTQKLIVR